MTQSTSAHHHMMTSWAETTRRIVTERAIESRDKIVALADERVGDENT